MWSEYAAEQLENRLKDECKMMKRLEKRLKDEYKIIKQPEKRFLAAHYQYGGLERSVDLMNSFKVFIPIVSVDWLVSLRNRDVHEFWCLASG
jgi:hypothetical protein